MESSVQCPYCGSLHVVKNGHVRKTAQQKYLCRNCKRQHADTERRWKTPQATIDLIRRLLLERLSLHGIKRALRISYFTVAKYAGEAFEEEEKRGVIEVKKKMRCPCKSLSQ